MMLILNAEDIADAIRYYLENETNNGEYTKVSLVVDDVDNVTARCETEGE